LKLHPHLISERFALIVQTDLLKSAPTLERLPESAPAMEAIDHRKQARQPILNYFPYSLGGTGVTVEGHPNSQMTPFGGTFPRGIVVCVTMSGKTKSHRALVVAV
jgi:hypothetical protein